MRLWGKLALPIVGVYFACTPSAKGKVYSRAQVSKHCTRDSVWVTHGGKVYDITDFVAIHPGGDKIMLAAGHSIEPFWAVFSIHASDETRSLLEQYCIGELMPEHLDKTRLEKPPGLEMLFKDEPPRDPSLIVRSARPFNAESPSDALLTRITPNHLFFTRNHLPVPSIPEKEYKLTIEANGVADNFTLDLNQLKSLPKETVQVTLQCAGNRRSEMHAVKPVKGLLWGSGAISNATWSGASLSQVLRFAGYTSNKDQDKHVIFDGADGYGASIPIEKAMNADGDVLLAYEMNGEPLPKDHGHPVRVVVPGHVAARSVKWVNSIRVSDDESTSHWQRNDYKGFSPSKTLETSDYSQAESIQELPVQSGFLTDKLSADNGKLHLEGYAVSGGGRGINRVDVSIDGGRTWTDAVLDNPEQPYGKHWAWTKWHLDVEDPKTPNMELVCKAVDSSYNVQPDSFEGIYNVRGVLVNAWQRCIAKIDRNNRN